VVAIVRCDYSRSRGVGDNACGQAGASLMGAIYDEVTRQRGHMITAGQVPRSVIFSTEGFSKALQERDNLAVRGAMQGPTYSGLKHTVDPNQTEDVVVSEQSVEEWARDRRPRGPVVSFTSSGLQGPMTMKVIGKGLTAAQLCDVIMAHCQPHIDAGTQTPLQRALYAAVTNFGRFK
jgi:hypothetical protein